MDVGSVRHWPRVPEAQLARIMSKTPSTRLASNSPAAQKSKTKAPTVVAARNVRDEDEDAEVVVTRPAQRGRVTASVAPQPAAGDRGGRSDAEVAPGRDHRRAGAVRFQSRLRLLAAGAPAESRQPESRQPESRQAAPEAAPSGGFNLASASSQPVLAAPRPAQAASLISANDIINERGYWQGLVETPARPVPPADIPEARPAAVAEAPITGSVARGSLAPWPMPDRAPARDAMAYASPSVPVETRPGQASKARVVAKLPGQRDGTTDTTAKQGARPGPASVKVGERFNNPWMRAMIVSPSAIEFMSTSLYGAPDTASLRPHLAKPASTVMMTFSDDPHLGMSSEQFRGNAVVFVATVTFRQRTAALR